MDDLLMLISIPLTSGGRASFASTVLKKPSEADDAVRMVEYDGVVKNRRIDKAEIKELVRSKDLNTRMTDHAGVTSRRLV